MESIDFTQTIHWFTQIGIWLGDLLIVLVGRLSLIGCVVCLGGALIQAWLELRHHRKFQLRHARSILQSRRVLDTRRVSVRLSSPP